MVRDDFETRTEDQAAAHARDNTWPDDQPNHGDIDDWPTVREPGTRLCVAQWISHTRTEFDVCDYCQGRKPVCSWAGRDRCQHHRHIDDPTVRWDTVARRYYCDVLEQAHPPTPTDPRNKHE